MTDLPVDNTILTNGEYIPTKAFLPGRAISVEISGTFDGASVQLGYASSDAAPIFVADSTAKTAAGRWTNFIRPASGLPAIKVTAAGAGTEILVTIVEQFSR